MPTASLAKPKGGEPRRDRPLRRQWAKAAGARVYDRACTGAGLTDIRQRPLRNAPFSAGLVVVAGGLNPIPFRTRPLNPPAPMVLCLKTRESRSLPGLPSTERKKLTRSFSSTKHIAIGPFRQGRSQARLTTSGLCAVRTPASGALPSASGASPPGSGDCASGPPASPRQAQTGSATKLKQYRGVEQPGSSSGS